MQGLPVDQPDLDEGSGQTEGGRETYTGQDQNEDELIEGQTITAEEKLCRTC